MIINALKSKQIQTKKTIYTFNCEKNVKKMGGGGRQLGAKVQGDHMFTRIRRFVCQRAAAEKPAAFTTVSSACEQSRAPAAQQEKWIRHLGSRFRSKSRKQNQCLKWVDALHSG